MKMPFSLHARIMGTAYSVPRRPRRSRKHSIRMRRVDRAGCPHYSPRPRSRTSPYSQGSGQWHCFTDSKKPGSTEAVMFMDAVIGCDAVDAEVGWLRLRTATGAMRTIPWSAVKIAGMGGNHEGR